MRPGCGPPAPTEPDSVAVVTASLVERLGHSPDSKLVVLSPATHFANRDQPEAWNRAALDFLARCDRLAARG